MGKISKEEITQRINTLTDLFNQGLNRHDIIKQGIPSLWLDLIKKYNIKEHFYCKHCSSTENLVIVKNQFGKYKINCCKECYNKYNKKPEKRKEKEYKKFICKTCENEFLSKAPNALFCSDNCNPYLKRKELICLNCGKIYIPEGGNHGFCNVCKNIKIKCACGCGKTIVFRNYRLFNTRFIKGHDIKPGRLYLSKEKLLQQLNIKRPEIIILSDLNSRLDEVKCKNINCNHEYKSSFRGLLEKEKNHCPMCSKRKTSQYEKIIKKFLQKHKIKFIPQFSFKDCKDKKCLKFDFYLPDYNVCIEYDGPQHYESISIWGGEKGLEDRKRKDNIKNQYCKNNNIDLIRIPYWNKESIEDCLKAVIIILKLEGAKIQLPQSFYYKLADVIEDCYREVI